MSLSLVVLAAGIGSRYGGPKQIDRVGPAGATLLDYAIYDAQRAGFERAILVVREGMQAEMREAVGDRIARRVRLDYAVQTAALPRGFVAAPGRTKPWGTGHATLAAFSLLDGPFAVINADDFYGASSYRILAEHLRYPAAGPLAEHALVGFPARCDAQPRRTGEPRHLRGRRPWIPDRGPRGVEDRARRRRRAVARRRWHVATASRRDPRLAQLLGLHARGVERARSGFERFLAENAASTTAEYYLPSAVQRLVEQRLARVRVLGGGGPWAGLTYPGDRPRLVELIATLTARGVYPAELWA